MGGKDKDSNQCGSAWSTVNNIMQWGKWALLLV
jgi:hypothetical protein